MKNWWGGNYCGGLGFGGGVVDLRGFWLQAILDPEASARVRRTNGARQAGEARSHEEVSGRVTAV